MDKSVIEATLASIDVWLLFFGVVGLIGVAGSTVFGIRHWSNNRKLQTILKVEDQQRQVTIEQTRERSAALSLKVEEESRKRAEAERDLLVLQEHLFKPRSFDWGKARAVLDNSPKGSAVVRYVPNDQGAFMLADGLYALLYASGWNVSVPEEGGASLPFTGVMFEIGVGETNAGVGEESLPLHVRALMRALGVSREELGKSESGLRNLGEFRMGARQDLPSGSLVIVVGPKY